MDDEGTYLSSITLPLSRSRLNGCSCRSPIAHFYIHHAGSSLRELHPFTTITYLASKNSATDSSKSDFPIQFLFRKQGKLVSGPEVEEAIEPKPFLHRMLRGKNKRVKSVQWTVKLASLADEKTRAYNPENEVLDRAGTSNESTDICFRLEGPYFTPANPYRYDLVVCMVAGTGISGALAIGSAFNYVSPKPSSSGIDRADPQWKRCIIIWSVKASDDIDLPFLEPPSEGLEVRKFLTGEGRERVHLEKELGDLIEGVQRTWVYISGPKPFIADSKEACKKIGKKASLDFYAASWDP